jgi:hypothetical protein
MGQFGYYRLVLFRNSGEGICPPRDALFQHFAKPYDL